MSEVRCSMADCAVPAAYQVRLPSGYLYNACEMHGMAIGASGSRAAVADEALALLRDALAQLEPHEFVILDEWEEDNNDAVLDVTERIRALLASAEEQP